MTHLLLRLINEAGWVYEHKLAAKLGKPIGFQELEDVVTQGFVERIDRELATVKGLRLTQAGKDELARLNAIPPIIPQPTVEQLRMQELRSKLKDNTITQEELKELLRIFFRV